MNPQEKVQQIANVLCIEIWMAMDRGGSWYIYNDAPKHSVRTWEVIAACILIEYDGDTPWKESLVHAVPLSRSDQTQKGKI